MSAPRKICVVTGSRAEYGLLYWLMKEIQADPELQLQLAVTGMHLAPEFGSTWQVIEQDGFAIDARVEMQLSSDTEVGTAKSVGLGVIGFADAFARLRPDIVVVLGDRFEILAAAQAAVFLRIPIAHLHGGELTEGAIDDVIRHALTKMSHLHFVAAYAYGRRVVQMGEDPQRVFVVGAPGLDYVAHATLIAREDLAADLDVSFAASNFLVTYHPATLGGLAPEIAFSELAKALDAYPEAHCIFTRSNADPAGRAMNALIDRYVASNPHRAWVFASLGQLRYLSMMNIASVVIGNSSSGLTEAPLMKVPTVNIGPRQDGRLRAPAVIDCCEDAAAIRAAIEQALSREHQAIAMRGESLYGYGNASPRIKEILARTPLAGLTTKHFHDQT